MAGRPICCDVLVCSRCVQLGSDVTRRPTAWARPDLGSLRPRTPPWGMPRETCDADVPKVVVPFCYLTTTDDLAC